MDSPFRTLANIIVPAMVIGLVFLLLYLKYGRAAVDPSLDPEELEERGY